MADSSGLFLSDSIGVVAPKRFGVGQEPAERAVSAVPAN